MPPPFNQIAPPAPTFTEKDVGSLSGKVFIVTGATSGVGYELAKILYGRGGLVYVAARSSEKSRRAIDDITAELGHTTGRLVPLHLDLADLGSIKRSAQEFLGQEDRLDVLVHNAGVMTPPAGSKTKLGHDLEMATNCLGPFLFSHFLEDILRRTAAAQPSNGPNAVRVVWVSSMIAVSVPQGGIVFDESTGAPKVLKNAMENYMESKVGNVFLASETAKRLGEDGVISLSVNPGLMKTELQRHGPALLRIIMGILFKPAKFGAYSELFAVLSPSITPKHGGDFIIPWGRFGPIPEHIAQGMKDKSEGGTGTARRFWDWCERETQPYM